MNNKEAKKFVEAVYHDIWAGNNPKKFDEYYHPDVVCVAHQPNGTELEMDFAAIKNHAAGVGKDRRKVETVFEEVVAQRNKIIARYRQRSINTQTSEVFDLKAVFEYQLENGKIKNIWAFFNRQWMPSK